MNCGANPTRDCARRKVLKPALSIPSVGVEALDIRAFGMVGEPVWGAARLNLNATLLIKKDVTHAYDRFFAPLSLSGRL